MFKFINALLGIVIYCLLTNYPNFVSWGGESNTFSYNSIGLLPTIAEVIYKKTFRIYGITQITSAIDSLFDRRMHQWQPLYSFGKGYLRQ